MRKKVPIGTDHLPGKTQALPKWPIPGAGIADRLPFVDHAGVTKRAAHPGIRAATGSQTGSEPDARDGCSHRGGGLPTRAQPRDAEGGGGAFQGRVRAGEDTRCHVETPLGTQTPPNGLPLEWQPFQRYLCKRKRAPQARTYGQAPNKSLNGVCWDFL